jgi:hypothetical protein
MTKYISFSVYGSNQIYQVGAIENLKRAETLYPGWKLIFYVDTLVAPDLCNDLQSLGAQVVIRDLNHDPHGMFWRFDALNLPDAEAVVFRDTDSRLSSREYLAVSEWESSGADLHIMRDHPFHSFWILGGMWGARGRLLSEISKALPRRIEGAPRWGLDQEWLAGNVYLPFVNDSLIHDSFFKREKSSLFPSRRITGEYVGESVDENGGFSEKLRDLVIRAESNPMYVRKLRARDWFRVRMGQALKRGSASSSQSNQHSIFLSPHN